MKKILLISPPFSGHLNVFKNLIWKYGKDFDFHLIITGWTNIRPDIREITVPTEIISRSELQETDPAIWTLPRVVELLDSCVKTVEKIKPDLIIYDFFSLEGYFIGKKLNIPNWCSIPALIGPFNNQEYLKSKLDISSNIKALKDLGLNPNGIEMISDGLHIPGELNLIWSYPSLTPKDFMQNRKPVNYTFVGNLTRLKTQKIIPENQSRPLIYFSLGTVVMDNLWNQQEETRNRLKEFIKILAEKWQNKPYDVLFVGRGKSVIDEYPSNWEVVDYADQISALSRASIFITHAGSNSFHEAIEKKVPMIAIPFFGDQPLVAQQIEQLGIGINLVSNTEIDTKKSKDFISIDLANKLDTSVQEMLTNLEKYKEKLNNLSLESEDIFELLRR